MKTLPESSKVGVFDHVDNTGSDIKSMMPASISQLKREIGEWKMLPVCKVQDPIVSAEYKELASAIMIDASD